MQHTSSAYFYFIIIIIKSTSYIAHVTIIQGTQGTEYNYTNFQKVGYCSDEFADQISKNLIRIYVNSKGF